MDARQVKTRKKVQEALASLLEEKTLEEISMGELAATAGISRTSIYRNYENRQSIVIGYIDEWFERHLQRLSESQKDAIESEHPKPARYIKVMLTHAYESNNLLVYAITGVGGAKATTHLLKLFQNSIRLLISKDFSHNTSPEDIDLIAITYSPVLLRIMEAYKTGELDGDIDTISTKLGQLINNGVSGLL